MLVDVAAAELGIGSRFVGLVKRGGGGRGQSDHDFSHGPPTNIDRRTGKSHAKGRRPNMPETICSPKIALAY
jgi:hypothetical protein